MNTRVLMACLAALVFSARADAIPFFDVQFDVTAVAVTGDGPAGVGELSSPPASVPVSVSVDSLGAVDIATAGAIAGPGLLLASADASAIGFASSVATAHFAGSFVNGSAISLSIDFTALDAASGSGGASTTLFVSLKSDGVTLFDDYVSGLWLFGYAPVVGTTSVLDLTLTSEANAAFLSPGPGDAGGFGLATIAGTVPEASTWLLFALGLGAVAAVRSGARRKSVQG